MEDRSEFLTTSQSLNAKSAVMPALYNGSIKGKEERYYKIGLEPGGRDHPRFLLVLGASDTVTELAELLEMPNKHHWRWARRRVERWELGPEARPTAIYGSRSRTFLRVCFALM